MLVYRDSSGLPAHPRAVALGTFDGVHIGHQRIIAAAVDEAANRGLASAVLTFDRHPLAVLAPAKQPRILTPLPVKLELLAGLGVEELVVLTFDQATADLTPDDFCRGILAKGLSAAVVVVGENFTFGEGGRGTPATLAALGRELGFVTIVVPLVKTGGKAISSSRIRRLLQRGHLTDVRAILGRPPSAQGRVVHGDKRGRRIGFPTANIEAEANLIFPGRGVYAARAIVRGRWYRAAVNIGHNPTFKSAAETAIVHVEAFLIGFKGDIYGEEIRVDFLAKVRDEERFARVEDLVAQMHADIALTGKLLDPAYDEVGLGPVVAGPA